MQIRPLGEELRDLAQQVETAIVAPVQRLMPGISSREAFWLGIVASVIGSMVVSALTAPSRR